MSNFAFTVSASLDSVDNMNIRNTTTKGLVFFLLLCFSPFTLSLTRTLLQRGGSKTQTYVRNGGVCSPLKSTAKNGMSDVAIAEQEGKFKIITCMSTACSRKRASLGLDSLCTFSAMYSRASDSRVQVEEGPCIGSCKKAPVVSIEHEDFFGSVALEGMTPDEFESDAFLTVVTEEDADRVWSCVVNAVQVMAEAGED